MDPETRNRDQSNRSTAGGAGGNGSLRKHLRRAAIAAAIFIVVSVIATELVLFVMFGQTKPLSKEAFPLSDWSAENGFLWKTVEFPCGKNTLRGYYILPPSPRALILIAHGMHGSSDGYEPAIEWFTESGYAVLIFDGTAVGRSDGKSVVGLQQTRYDIRAAIGYVRTNEALSDLPLVLLGHSVGAYAAATEAETSGARAVVCVSGFDRPVTSMYRWARRYTFVLSDIEYPFLLAREYVVLGKDANTSAAAALTDSGVPAMIVQGADDDAVMPEISLFTALEGTDAECIVLRTESAENHSGHGNIICTPDGEPNIDLLEAIDAFLRPILGGAGTE